MINRRSALKQLALLTGGVVLAPSCVFDSQRVSVALDNLKITSEQEELLAEIVETIIPATQDIPGAKKLDVHLFVLVMVDDCREKADQERFVRGLKQMDAFTLNRYGHSFIEANQKERESILTDILDATPAASDDSSSPQKDIREFLSMTKRYTIQGYLQSQYVMTEIFPYELVPGHFEGCVKTKIS